MVIAALVALVLGLLAAPAAVGATAAGISGHVTRASGGAAVAGAKVCAEEQGGEFEFECSHTEADGSYQIVGLDPGQYVVSFEAGESGLNLAPQYYNGFSVWQQAARVTVAAETVTPTIDAALVAGGTASGKVTAAATGLPIAEVEVCAWLGGQEFEGCTETTGNGSYELTRLPAGQYELEFWAYERGYEPQFLESVSVSAGATTPNQNAALVLFGRISGHVYAAATHLPLVGVSVCAIWSPSGETGGCGQTSSAGAYSFFPAPAGAWKIAFSPEPAEVEFFEGVKADSWPTQFWSSKPTLAQANAVNVTAGSAITGIDGLLGPGPSLPVPAPSGPAPSVTPTPLKKASPCPKGKVRKRVKGKLRCVKRHKHRHRHHRHR